jgi:uncharacterized protein
MNQTIVKRSAMILMAVALFEAAFIVIFPDVFLRPLLLHWDRGTLPGWILALGVAAAFVVYSVRGLPTIGKYLWNVSPFKLTGIALAIPAAILEEVFFRQFVMNLLIDRSIVIQVVASALSFGLGHAIWGIRGGWRAMTNAVASTTLMGVALAVVFLASNRTILPCIVSHFIITATLEPWLIYAYIERALAKAAIPEGLG